jgi:hypothetical protein
VAAHFVDRFLFNSTEGRNRQMQTEYESTTVVPDITPYGKIFGVAENRDQLKRLCEALAELGIREVEIFDGSAGVQRLTTWHDASAQHLLGERETSHVLQYLEALKDHCIVFAAVVESGLENAAAETANAQGASQIVHFGNSVVTSY